jgi:tRNA pseudouridine38-40 synthase
VHATAQTLHGDVPSEWRLLDDLDQARTALDGLVGAEITVWRIRVVPATFDARFSAVSRAYRYRICDADAMNPLWRHDTWHAGSPRLDVVAMAAGARHLVGEHDFSSFCRRAPGQAHLVRRIDSLAVHRQRASLVAVDISGKAFCHQMVRSIVGCLAVVGRGHRRPGWVGEVLAARDRQAAGDVAPPHGLTLVSVRFR